MLCWFIAAVKWVVARNILNGLMVDIVLPANIVPGEYQVRTIHFREGAVMNDSVTMLNVGKSGLSAEIYRFAHEYAPFYGIFAIIFAVASGWLAAVAFRK